MKSPFMPPHVHLCHFQRGPFLGTEHDRRPTSAPNDVRIEQALLKHGVILFAEPTPGARLAEKTPHAL
jgi:hypothetical protein